jgi:hypothetical protein
MTFAGHHRHEQECGYLSYNHYVVRTVTEELSTHGLAVPFLFSSLTLDVNSSGIRRPIQAFLHTCIPFPTLEAECT